MYISECLIDKKSKIINQLKKNRLLPGVYVISLSRGGQNQLEFWSSVFFRYHFYENSTLFVVGLAYGQEECLEIIRQITEKVYKETGGSDLKKYILQRQNNYEKTGM